MMFSNIPGSEILCLYLILKKWFLVINISHIFFFSPSLFSSWYFNFSYVEHLEIVHEFLDILFFPLCTLAFLWILVCEISTDASSSLLILSLVVSSL